MSAARPTPLTVRWLPTPTGPHPCGPHPCIDVAGRVVHGAAAKTATQTLCQNPFSVTQAGAVLQPAGAAICPKCQGAASGTTGGGPASQ